MSKLNWIQAKSEYMTDSTMSYVKLAQKYGVAVSTIADKAGSERWAVEKERTLAKIEQNAIDKTIEKASESIAEVNLRHINTARLLQKEGIVAITQRNVKPIYARDAKDYIVEGINLERKALNMDSKENTTNVNIQNNMMTMVDFMKAMHQRQLQREAFTS